MIALFSVLSLQGWYNTKQHLEVVDHQKSCSSFHKGLYYLQYQPLKVNDCDEYTLSL